MFTVGVPTHDRRETVLLAVRSLLTQTCPPEKIMVLCDGCTDGTADAVRGLDDSRIEVLELPKAAGYGYAHRNLVIERATTEAVLWLADDDLLLPDHLELFAAALRRDGADLVQGQSVLVHEDDRLEWVGGDWTEEWLRQDLARSNPSTMSAVGVRVDLLRRIGGWNATLPRAADWDLWQRAVAATRRIAVVHEPTHLHFRATSRVQSWTDRVRQNRDWARRLDDPDELASIRRDMRHTRSVRESGLIALYVLREAELAEHARVVAAYEATVAAREAVIEQLCAELSESRSEAGITAGSVHALARLVATANKSLAAHLRGPMR